MKEIVIRKPYENEYETWASTYQIYLNFYKTSLTQDELMKVWSWLFGDHQEMTCYFAEYDQQIVGLVHFRRFVRPLKACSGIFLDDLIVLPEFRGHGVGYKLIEAVKRYAKENNLSIVRWITAQDNHAAMHLYNTIASKTIWVTYDAKID